MNLKDKKYFYFTQNSLNTFKSCPFRFKKKYIDNIKWEKDENSLTLTNAEFGVDFHKVAQRYFSNIPVYEETFSDNEELFLAYQNLKEYFPLDSNSNYYPEYTLRYKEGDIRLEANIDLIIIKDDLVEIWDWKTNAKNNGDKYIKSLQTEIYMLAFKKCSEKIFGREFSNIKMSYFSPENKSVLGSVLYSDEKFKKDEENITNLIKKIYNFKWEKFDRNEFLKQCKFCEFNLFCDNVKFETKYEFADFDWDNIEEFF